MEYDMNEKDWKRQFKQSLGEYRQSRSLWLSPLARFLATPEVTGSRPQPAGCIDIKISDR